MEITHAEIIDCIGAAVLMEMFGITASAVSQWKSNDSIPEARLMYLKLVRPDVFGTPPACDCTPTQQQEAA